MEQFKQKVEEKQVRKAVIALLAYVNNTSKSSKQTLFDPTDLISLQIGLKKIPEKGKAKPVRM